MMSFHPFLPILIELQELVCKSAITGKTGALGRTRNSLFFSGMRGSTCIEKFQEQSGASILLETAERLPGGNSPHNVLWSIRKKKIHIHVGMQTTSFLPRKSSSLNSPYQLSRKIIINSKAVKLPAPGCS